MMPSKRLFIGISLTENHQRELVEFQNHFPNNQHIRLVPIENLHITIQFLGNTLTEAIPHLCENLENIISKNMPFRLEFKQYQVNPGSRPSMVWAVYYPQVCFHELQKDVSGLTNGPQFHKPIIHCTLARFKPMANYKAFQFSNVPKNRLLDVCQIKLFESVLLPTGPVYSVLETFELC